MSTPEDPHPTADSGDDPGSRDDDTTRPIDAPPPDTDPDTGAAAGHDAAGHDAAGNAGAAPGQVKPSRAKRRRGGTRFVFVDTEATGLDHQRHELTEVAWVVRFEDGSEAERRFFPQHTVDGADADALELTHYDDRIAPQDKTPAHEWLTLFLEDAQDAVLVGAVPDFDAKHLERMCRKLGIEPTWDHHLLDVETLALPLIAAGPEAPRSLAKTCAALGVPHDKDQAHGALYDAQQAKRVFDRVWELVAELRASGGPLPPAVPRDTNNNHNNHGNHGTDHGTEPSGTPSGAIPDSSSSEVSTPRTRPGHLP